jgi:putative addiction module component (TIGR02574 family)
LVSEHHGALPTHDDRQGGEYDHRVSCRTLQDQKDNSQPIRTLRQAPPLNVDLPFLLKKRYHNPMTLSPKQVLKDALQLPDHERAELAAELLDSLPPALSGQDRSNTQWLAEIERRAKAAQAGAPGITWEDAREQVLNRLPKP